MKKAFIFELITAQLVMMFLYTGLSKLLDFKAFELSMRFQHQPDWITTPMIYLLPAAELIVAFLLIPDRSRLIGLYSFFLLMSGFTFYIGAILLKLFPVSPCPCGGVIGSLGWGQHFVFNLVFLLLTLADLRYYRGRRTTTMQTKPYKA